MGEVLKFVTSDGVSKKKTQKKFCAFLKTFCLNFKTFLG